ncbi:MAG: YidC/Oxa1 family membrane protein insertase [Clostridia bacterium]|nr:YidC/Oxa1 family membrane protein insertase [Clostridia bacterium]
MFDFLLKPLGYVIQFFYSFTHSYLVSVLLFALLIEIILSPLQIKQQKSSIKQAKLAPKVKAIQKKYAGRNDNVSKQKMQQETMDLYREEGFNPAGGCLPLLIQLPVILCVWQIITRPLTYLCGVSSEAVGKLAEMAKNLGVNFGTYAEMGLSNWLRSGSQSAQAAAAKFLDKPLADYRLPEFKLFGLDLSPNPSINPINWLVIIPILVFLAMWGSMVIMKKFTYQAPEAAEAQNKLSMRIMNLAMPALSTWFSFQMPAVVGVYWIFRNILSVGERFLISKIFPIPKMTDDEMAKAEKEYGGKMKEKEANKPPVRSLHRIDWDDEELPPPVPDSEEDEEEDEKPAEPDAGDPAPSDEQKPANGLLDRVPMKEDGKEKKSRKEKKNKKE